MNIQEFFPLIKYINLDERIDRKELAEKEFIKLGIQPERFSAIKRENGAEGCYLSHLNLLKEAQISNSNLLVFEDDVQFCENAKEMIENALDELSRKDWVLFYLGGNILRPAYQVSKHLAKLSHCQSTHAISYNIKYIPQIIEFLEHNQFILDVLYADYVVPATECYITVPMVATQRSDFSSIEKQVMTYDIPIERYNKFLVRKEGL
jgi:glycosyl transferase family 25